MAWYPYQGSFQAGEISPRLYGQTASEFYKRGVQFSENWLHLPQGPVRYRQGSEYILNAASNTNIRLIPFNIVGQPGSPSPTDLCLELTVGKARLLSEGGVVHLVSAPQQITNNDFTLGTTNWTTTGGYVQYEWLGAQATMNMEIPDWENDPSSDGGGPIHPTHPPATPHPSIQQKMANVPAGVYRLQVGFPIQTPTDLSNGWTDLHTVSVHIGTTPGASDVYLITGQSNINLDVNVTVPAGPPVDLWITFYMDSPDPPAFHGTGQIAKVYFPRFTGAATGDADISGLPWTDDMLPGIQYAQDIFFGMVLVHPLMHPQVVTYSPGGFAITPIAFASPPADWTNGPPVNWPSTVEIWQGRLWLANTPDRPTTIWASSTGNYLDFAIPGTPAADSPIVVTLATKGAIKWMRGKQSFLIGTEFHEDTIVSATSVVSSLDAQLVRQSGYGSSAVQAQEIGDQVLFISRDASKLRALNFNFDTQAWTAHDISYFAQGIFLPTTIVDVAYVRDPDNTIFVLCGDGTMRMCTYDRAAEVVAWSRWRTSGSVKALCATIDPTGTTLWLAINRNGMNFIETVPAFTVQTPIFLDSYNQSVPTVYTPMGETQNRISIPCGHHLDGFTVGVLVDGTYLGQGNVVAGIVDLPFAGASASVAIVGVPYTATMTTLPMDGGVMYGSGVGLDKSRTKIFITLLPNSNVPLINGQLPAARFPATPMNTVSPIPTDEWYWWVTNTGWDRYQRVTLTQNQPFQCEVAAIFGRSEVTQL